MTARDTLLLRADIRNEQDVVLIRQRARHIAMLLGFDSQDQTRIATSVSEIARNAFEYAGGGRVGFLVSGGEHPAYLIRIADDGPGIPNIDAVLEGRYESPTGMGLGLLGARRLVDLFDIRTGSGSGTIVTGTAVENERAFPPETEFVRLAVGPSSGGVFKAGDRRPIAAGDVVIVPAGMPHGFDDITDHLTYLSIRPDLAGVLPANYVHPALRK